MSVRGSQGGLDSSRGPGRGRGRGRGRGKKTIWEWESYTPGPEVYQQLWRIRKEPTTVTPRLPDQSPHPYVRTRILDRRQTEDDIRQNFYIVETVQQSPNSSQPHTTIEHVDLSCILAYVSPLELERFENEQFRIEAEAEAVAARVEAEELARRRLERNARVPGRTGLHRGRGRGSRILSGLGQGMEALHVVSRRGRPRGSRGRPRGSWRALGQLALSSALHDEIREQDVVNTRLSDALHNAGEDLDHVIEETDSEEESLADEPTHSSPNLMRSAFVANSALSISPAARKTLPPLDVRRQVSASPHISESDIDLTDYDARSTSGAAAQLQQETEHGEHIIPESQESRAESSDIGHHRNKRRRAVSNSTTSDLPVFKAPTGSVFEPEGPYTQQLLFRESSLPDIDPLSEPERPQPQDLMFRNQSSIPEYESEASNGESPYQGPPASTRYPNKYDEDVMDLDDNTMRVLPLHDETDLNHTSDGDGDAADNDDAEEYVVESIIEHFYEGGKKYYLVKWGGYEDSHDWLPEEDLTGAADMVSEYNRKLAQKKGKQKAI
ncbi:hypothetical protein T440DRAFT_461034 [Plenodomus tracheiphilus IPT5]|uniref:Chromo domain-containing protein n=1 Tax=Plenodomus tracheiphilus IPT5 TaxID=1408161 RepID=A0A6A7ASI5_9PLEO|nr:hypothetical protein T440DRAFT_461034 [Plenodomus tracheiphilus IPT5]